MANLQKVPVYQEDKFFIEDCATSFEVSEAEVIRALIYGNLI